jgi:hypothetical protein
LQVEIYAVDLDLVGPRRRRWAILE